MLIISKCFVGAPCRYDGKDKLVPTIKADIFAAHNGIACIVQSCFHEMINGKFADFAVENCSITRNDF